MGGDSNFFESVDESLRVATQMEAIRSAVLCFNLLSVFGCVHFYVVDEAKY